MEGTSIEDIPLGSKFSVPAGGATLTSISCYIEDAGGFYGLDVAFSVYSPVSFTPTLRDETGTSALAQNFDGWKTIDVLGSTALGQFQDVWLFAWATQIGGSFYFMYYDSGSGGDGDTPFSGQTFDDWPTTFSDSSGDDHDRSIYGTYGAAPPTGWPNDINAVESANLDEADAVETANIDEIDGV